MHPPASQCRVLFLAGQEAGVGSHEEPLVGTGSRLCLWLPSADAGHCWLLATGREEALAQSPRRPQGWGGLDVAFPGGVPTLGLWGFPLPVL